MKKSKQEIRKKLYKIGFSEHEAKIYLALLEIGLTSVGNIIKKTALHRNIVYTTLDKLAIKKYVLESNKKNIKYYSVASINRIAKDKEREFELAQSIMPELEDLRKSENVGVTIYEGMEGFQTAHIEAVRNMQKNDTIFVSMAGGKIFYKSMGDELKTFDKIRAEKQNKIKILASKLRREELLGLKTQKRDDVVIKFLQMNFLNPIGSSIYGQRTLLFVYTKSPIVISIESESVAKAHREYFKELWKTAIK